jgi:hypothetical protein
MSDPLGPPLPTAPAQQEQLAAVPPADLSQQNNTVEQQGLTGIEQTPPNEGQVEEEVTYSEPLNNKNVQETTKKDNDDSASFSYENVTIDDVDNDGKDNPVGINGIPWAQMHVRQLRIICSRLSVRGVKNAKKAHIIEALTRWCRNRWNYNAMMAVHDSQDSGTMASGRVVKTSRKEVQCTFRLMNILFSDEFACEFATLGDVANRATLDTGKGGSNQLFWERVQDAFTEPNNDNYDRLYFIDDDVFAAQGHINPSQIVEHDWKKLRVMWKSVNADYKSALT